MSTAIEVLIDDDMMTARLRLPAGPGVPLEALRGEVLGRGICHGLQREALAEATRPASQERELVVARGTRPHNGLSWRWGKRGDLRDQFVAEDHILAHIVDEGKAARRPGMAVDGSPREVPEGPARLPCGMAIDDSLRMNVSGDLVARRNGYLRIDDDGTWRLDEDPKGKRRLAVKVLVDESRLKAWIRLEAREYVLPEVLKKALAEARVSYGIRTAAVAEVSEGGAEWRTVVVAEGEAAEDGQDARVEHLIEEKVSFEVDDDGSLDFRDANIIRQVEQGQPLVRRLANTPGRVGMTVLGRRLDPTPGRDLDLSRYAGEGTDLSRHDPNTIIAARPGVYIQRPDGTVEVKQMVVVEGDLDFHTGNIDSEYPVHVRGDVKAGFKVVSGSDVMVDGSVEDAAIEAAGSLVVREGILPGKEPITVTGDVSARYLRERTIHCRNLLIRTSLRHSEVFAFGEVAAQEILGGQVIAAGDITAGEIGDENEQRTIVQAGVDPRAQARYEAALADRQRLTDDNRRLRERLEGASQHATQLARKASLMAQQHTAKSHLDAIANEARDAMAKAKAMAEAYDAAHARLQEAVEIITQHEAEEEVQSHCVVVVKQTAWPNVDVLIGNRARRRLEEAALHARFHLAEGRIVW